MQGYLCIDPGKSNVWVLALLNQSTEDFDTSVVVVVVADCIPDSVAVEYGVTLDLSCRDTVGRNWGQFETVVIGMGKSVAVAGSVVVVV